MKIVLAYSGGLDTSIILKWLKEHYSAEVVSFTADIGQGDEVEMARQKALKTGACAAHAVDLREEFVRDYVFPMLRTGALYEGQYLMGTSIARPLIAKAMLKIAKEEGASAIAHGATGKGNDQVRFELNSYAINPDIKVIAPWREWDFTGREDMLQYAREHGIETGVSKSRPYSMDANMLHISYEGDVLEDPWVEPPRGMCQLTVEPEDAPDKPEYVEIQYLHGDPVAVNDRPMRPFEVLEELNTIAGRHGVGRVDIVENRFVGMKSRGVYETPGGTLIFEGRRAVESLSVDREVLHQREGLALQYAKLVYNGFWFAPERESLQVYMDHVARAVSGVVRLKLYKGSASVVGRKADRALYDQALVSFEEEGGYRQADAEGFIRLNATRLRSKARLEKPK